MKLLFIGNSYTYYNDMPKLFEALANENGKEVSVDSVTKGGRWLHENLSPEDENHKIICELNKNRDYDVLFLQEQSCGPIRDMPAFMRGAEKLSELVGAARTILYATWGRKSGSPTLLELSMTSDEMTDALYEGYMAAKKSLGAEISPVGLCFKEISKENEALELYNRDLSHPSPLGSCVAAVCHYTTVFYELPKEYSSLNISDEEMHIILDAIKSIKTDLEP